MSHNQAAQPTAQKSQRGLMLAHAARKCSPNIRQFTDVPERNIYDPPADCNNKMGGCSGCVGAHRKADQICRVFRPNLGNQAGAVIGDRLDRNV